MKLLEIASFFLAVLCVCTVGEDGNQTTTVSESASAVKSKAVVDPVNTTASQATSLTASVLVASSTRAASETIASNSTPPSTDATKQATQGTTPRPPVVTSAANTSFSTANTTQASGMQVAQNGSLDAASTMGSFSSTVCTEGSTFASGTSGLPVSSPTSLTNVILPIVITLIVITLSVFSLVALYKMCQKKTPERQENGAEQAQSDKEGVKLLSVKTTSSETGEHSSHGKNKTRQLFTSQQ
ncbi:PREDICTED: endomucin isoform X3 [Corvus brachyrhynchos]|uniref:endomucin isoform X3 n=1 Tax=Corvus brachyrhynchos TaxID=85066 RepID=UPI00081638CE|nr:PREDICTED: endomucin isoform X3 [Corvus brachyrhynchos]